MHPRVFGYQGVIASEVHFWTASVAQRREASSLSGHFVHFRSRERDGGWRGDGSICHPPNSLHRLPPRHRRLLCVPTLSQFLSSSVSRFTLVAAASNERGGEADGQGKKRAPVCI